MDLRAVQGSVGGTRRAGVILDRAGFELRLELGPARGDGLADFPARQPLAAAFNPLLRLIGYSRYNDDPRGIVLYWQVAALPDDRTDLQSTVSLLDARGGPIANAAPAKRTFGVPPLDWAIGDIVAEWYEFDMPDNAAQFSVQLTRGAATWQSPVLAFK